MRHEGLFRMCLAYSKAIKLFAFYPCYPCNPWLKNLWPGPSRQPPTHTRTSQQLLDRFALTEDRQRPVGGIVKLPVRIDTEDVIDSGEHVARLQRPVLRHL